MTTEALYESALNAYWNGDDENPCLVQAWVEYRATVNGLWNGEFRFGFIDFLKYVIERGEFPGATR